MNVIPVLLLWTTFATGIALLRAFSELKDLRERLKRLEAKERR